MMSDRTPLMTRILGAIIPSAEPVYSDACPCKTCTSELAGLVPCVNEMCPQCAGAGQSLLSTDPCHLCSGTGVRP